MPEPLLLLASASPRRRELLETIGLAFDVVPAAIDESPRDGESATDAARRLAASKAETVLAQHPEATVLGADTLVVLDGAPLGKPVDADDARAMLRRLSGRWHEVVTAVALARRGGTRTASALTAVRFAGLEEDEIARYVAGGEPMDKAGAYAIQGAGGWLVEEVRGSVSNVIGLPLETLRPLFAELGLVPTLAPGAARHSSP